MFTQTGLHIDTFAGLFTYPLDSDTSQIWYKVQEVPVSWNAQAKIHLFCLHGFDEIRFHVMPLQCFVNAFKGSLLLKTKLIELLDILRTVVIEISSFLCTLPVYHNSGPYNDSLGYCFLVVNTKKDSPKSRCR